MEWNREMVENIVSDPSLSRTSLVDYAVDSIILKGIIGKFVLQNIYQATHNLNRSGWNGRLLSSP